MIKPEDLTSTTEIATLEEEIDKLITVEYTRLPTGPHTIFIKNINSFTPAAWHVLKPRYAQHWEILDSIGKTVHNPYIQFKRPEREFSMIGHTFQGDK